MYKEILVNVDDWETKVAVLENQNLVELFIERSFNQRLVGNIYKGKVENVLPGMQAAFVNIGLEKNAFLYVEDALGRGSYGSEHGGTAFNVSINEVLREGQELFVQVSKEPIGTKGARVTTQITLPGRYLVLMPTVNYVGISRRIEKEGEKERLKSLAKKICPPDMGLIVRTVAEGLDIEEMERDVWALTQLWYQIQRRSRNESAPVLLHQDLELIQRILRDIFSEDVDRMIINTSFAYEKVMDLLDLVAPHLKGKVKLEEVDLFEKYYLESQIEKAMKRKVWLKCGGYLVIDQTEALTTVDVNTGKYVGTTKLEDTVVKTNLDAVVEIVRQIRLRNIGGIIIVDFIDMDSAEHRVQVIELLEEELRKDKTKSNVLGLTQLGLVEITRKKVRQSLNSIMYRHCPYCEGRGVILSEESISINTQREIYNICKSTEVPALLVEANSSIAALLIGGGGNNLRKLEEKCGCQIIIKGIEHLHLEDVRIRLLRNPKEIEYLSAPVKVGQILEVKIEEPHTTNKRDGIARLQGYVLDIEEGCSLLGEWILVEITEVFRTYAKARVVGNQIDI